VVSERQQIFDYIGLENLHRERGRSIGRLVVQPHLIAPNGYLQATVVFGMADITCAGGTFASLPPGAASFTTIEMKMNMLGTAREGALRCEATMLHGGRTTQVWEALVTREADEKRVALFRCTQLMLYP